MDTSKEEKLQPKDVPIVKDFIEVFPEELPGLPPDRVITFEIELLPGTAPISKAPYQMAPAELKELQTQLRNYSIKVLFVQVIPHGGHLSYL